MPSVLLAGAFGQRNPGDEMLLAAFIRALPEWTPVATTRDPERTRSDHGIATVPAWDAPAVAREVARAAAVVFAGGTVFKLLSPSTGRRPLKLLGNGVAVATAAHAIGRPVALVGVGAGDIRGRGATTLTRALVNRSDLLVLRDEESAAVLQGAGARAPFRVGADPAWTLLGPAAAAGAAEHAGSGVVVALSHLAGDGRLATRLGEALARVDAAGLPVALQPWQPGEDQRMAEAVARVLIRRGGRTELVGPPRDLGDARAAFAGAQVVLALRFHALVAAAAAGTPFAAVAHEAKLAALARRLGQHAAAPETAPQALADIILRAAGGPPPDTRAVRQEVSRAEDGFRLLRILISRGRSAELGELGGLQLVPQEWVA